MPELRPGTPSRDGQGDPAISYACCAEERRLPHCGRCPELICERFTRYRDPSMSDDDVERTLASTKAALLHRTD